MTIDQYIVSCELMKRLKKKKHEKLEQVIQTKLTLNENEENLGSKRS